MRHKFYEALGLESIALCLWLLTLFLQFSENTTFAKFYQKKKDLYWNHKKDHEVKHSENLIL